MLLLFAAATYVSFWPLPGGVGSRFFSSDAVEPGDDWVDPGSDWAVPSDTELTNVDGSAVRSFADTLNRPRRVALEVLLTDDIKKAIGRGKEGSNWGSGGESGVCPGLGGNRERWICLEDVADLRCGLVRAG